MLVWWQGLCIGARTLRVRNPIQLKFRHVWGLLHVASYVVAKCHSAGVVRRFREELIAQVSSSSSDRGSKLRDPSQENPRVAKIRDVNISKHN
ncbi:hypothetical protein AVEN_198569-1 [Araneus ventricosus]|uniref:Uncharacterized protein n=1 Tax=Araneus ventricosus TaxID=182803 RepID=A0A4Y2JZ38_ARAVE|nr:hypothetical protein AVEN_198569-1 [Araneus ventricosus]